MAWCLCCKLICYLSIIYGNGNGDNLHTYIHFYLLKNEVKANNIYKLSTTNEQDNKATSCTYSLFSCFLVFIYAGMDGNEDDLETSCVDSCGDGD